METMVGKIMTQNKEETEELVDKIQRRIFDFYIGVPYPDLHSSTMIATQTLEFSSLAIKK